MSALSSLLSSSQCGVWLEGIGQTSRRRPMGRRMGKQQLNFNSVTFLIKEFTSVGWEGSAWWGGADLTIIQQKISSDDVIRFECKSEVCLSVWCVRTGRRKVVGHHTQPSHLVLQTYQHTPASVQREQCIPKQSGLSFLSQTWYYPLSGNFRRQFWDISCGSCHVGHPVCIAEPRTEQDAMSVSLLARPLQETILLRQGAQAALQGLAGNYISRLYFNDDLCAQRYHLYYKIAYQLNIVDENNYVQFNKIKKLCMKQA